MFSHPTLVENHSGKRIKCSTISFLVSTPANELCRLITRRHNDNNDNNDQDCNDNVNGNADDNNADKNNNGNDAKSQLNSQNDKVPLSFPVSFSRDKIL